MDAQRAQTISEKEGRLRAIHEEQVRLEAEIEVLGRQETSREVNDVFHPSTVKISCGCSEDRRKQCRQKGSFEDGFGQHLNKQCHVFMHELDLLEIVHHVVVARFSATEKVEERPVGQKEVINYLRRTQDAMTSGVTQGILQNAIATVQDFGL